MAFVGQLANGKEPPPQLVIQSAEADYGSDQIIIVKGGTGAKVDFTG